MEKIITDYLITNLAPQLSIRFNLNLHDVEQEIRSICETTSNQQDQKQDQRQDQKQDQHQRQDQQQDQKQESEEQNVEQLSKLTIPQLKKLAIAKHIKISQKVKKNEIIQIIIVDQKNKKSVQFKEIVKEARRCSIDDKKPGVPKKDNINFNGQTFTSKSGQQWTIGKSIGSGGFGVIYDVVPKGCCVADPSGPPREAQESGPYVIKLEKNKPGVGLFFETSVYRKLKSDGSLKMIDSGKLTRLNLPLLEKDEEYYYLVLPKFETTLSEKIEKGMTLQEKNNAINDILNRLKYINSKGYIHLDIKPDNIMFLKNEWYLIDFGISYNYVDKEILNKKQAGNGTPLYMARDMHIGLASRKADLESLIYVLLKMNNIKFPWIREQEKQEKKETFLNWILEQKDDFMEKYKDLKIPQSHKNFIEKVNELNIKHNLDYDNLKIKM